MGISVCTLTEKQLLPMVKEIDDQSAKVGMGASNGIFGRIGTDIIAQRSWQKRQKAEMNQSTGQDQITRRNAPQPVLLPYVPRSHEDIGRSHPDALQSNKAICVPQPLFERFHNDEATEMKTYVKIIESQNRRLLDLERVHDDLERRLEVEASKRMNLEKRLDEERRVLDRRFKMLERERDDQKKIVEIEKKQNERLREQLYRKDKEIRRFYQRKYDTKSAMSSQNYPSQQRQQGGVHGSSRASPLHNSPSASPSPTDVVYRSPHELLASKGSGDAVRELNVTTTLKDFFGL